MPWDIHQVETRFDRLVPPLGTRSCVRPIIAQSLSVGTRAQGLDFPGRLPQQSGPRRAGLRIELRFQIDEGEGGAQLSVVCPHGREDRDEAAAMELGRYRAGYSPSVVRGLLARLPSVETVWQCLMLSYIV